jgi:hypothetical protein
VLVTDAVTDQAMRSDHLEFEDIGEVKLKGFDQPAKLCRALPRED